MSKVLVIFDTQIRPDNLELNTPLMQAIGQLIVNERPTHVVHIGDHFDMKSLCSHDFKKNNRLVFDGAEVAADVAAGRDAMWHIIAPLLHLQEHQRHHKKRLYQPELHFCIGNHEERIKRYPELKELVTYDKLFAHTGFEVHDYLNPVNIGGVTFSHYMYNPLSGRPLGGTAEYRLNKLKYSFVQGHEQVFKYAQEFLNNGKAISALVCGSCYLHEEGYKGPQGNNHFRGVAMLHNVNDGMYDLEQISVERLLSAGG